MAEGAYSAGSVFLEVVPSFKRFGEQRYYRDAEEAGRELGKHVGEAFDEEFGKTAGRGAKQALDKNLGPATEAGGKAGKAAGGAFEKQFKTNVAAAVGAIGKDVDKELDGIRDSFSKLGKLKINTEVDARTALRQFAALHERLKAVARDDDITLDARFNAAQAERDLAGFRLKAEAALKKPIELNVDLDSNRARTLRERVEKELARPLRTTLEVQARSENARRDITRLVKEMNALRAEIKVGLDSGAAEARVVALQRALDAIGDKDVDVDVRIAAATAQAELDALARPFTVEAKVEVDKDEARGELRQIQREFALIQANMKLDLDSADAIIQIAALDERLDALDGRQVDIDFNIDAARTRAQLQAIRHEVRSMDRSSLDAANSFRSFSGVVLGLATLGPLVVPALAGIAGGILAVGTAAAGVGAGLGVMMLGFSGLGDAIGALGDVQDDAAQDSVSSARTMRGAANSVRDAEIALSRAREAAAEGGVAASRRVQDAREALARAEQQVSRDVEDAIEREAAAYRTLERSQRDVVQAQQDLVEARRRAEQDMQDMNLDLRQGVVAERAAIIELQRAARVYRNIRDDPQATPIEREDASIQYERAQLALEDIRTQNERMRQEQRKFEEEGVDGTDRVKDAQDRLSAALESQANAQRALGEAAEATNLARADGALRVADAERAVTDAVIAQQDARVDGSRAVEDAQRRLTDAQLSYQDALFQTAEVGSAAMQKLEDSMSKLGPAGQSFARFIFGLRDEFFALRNVAQEGMLPGLQAGLTTLLAAYGPQLLEFVGSMSGVLGSLFEDMATGLTSPVWRDFFDMMAEFGPVFMQQFGSIVGSISTVFAQILTATAPFAKAFGDALVSLTEGWVAFLESDEGQEMFASFLDYLADIGPQVWELLLALGAALLNLAVAIAPYAEDLMRGFTAILNFVAGMDPKVLGVIVVSLITVVTAFQALVGIVSLIVGTGVVTSAFSALAAVLGGVSSAVAGTTAVVAAVVGAIVAAVIVIGGAFYLLWNHSETFRDVTTAAWEGVQAAVAAVIDWMVNDAWPMLQGAWDGIAAGATWLWQNVLSPIWSAMQAGFAVLAEVISVIWDTVLWPVFQFFGDVVQGLWALILYPIWLAISTAFNVMATTLAWIWNSVLGPVFQLFGAVVSLLWNATLGPIFSWIGERFGEMANLLEAAWEVAIKPALEAFRDFMEDTLAPAFDRAVEAIKTAWDRVREIAAAPIRFIIETVINDGLIAGFNFLARAFGTDEIADLPVPKSLQGFHAGGWTGPGSKYEPAGVVHADEFVVRKESQRKMRRQFPGLLEHINATGTLPGYSDGGLVEFGKMLQRMGFRVAEHPEFGGVSPVHTRGSKHYNRQAIDVNYAPGTSKREQDKLASIVPLARERGFRVIFMTKGHYGHAHFDTDEGESILGKVGGFLGDMFDNINPVDWLKDKVTGALGDLGESKFAQILIDGVQTVVGWATDKVSDILAGVGEWLTGGGDQTGPDGIRDIVRNAAAGYGWDTGGMWSSLEWLVNKESSWNPNAQNPTSTAYGLFQFLNGTWAGTDYAKSSDPKIQAAAGLQYIRERYGNPMQARMFHMRNGYYADGGLVGDEAAQGAVPVGLFDDGGRVPPGLSGVLNLTGADEHMAVFTQQQWAALRDLASSGSGEPGPAVTIPNATFLGYDPQEIAAEIRMEWEDAVELQSLGGGA